MKPPKCRLCETYHWNNEPHKFKEADRQPDKGGDTSRTARDNVVAAVPSKERVGEGADEPSRTPNRRDRKDYNAYQREYMRKWRKK